MPFCAWCRLPLICMKLLVGVCACETGLLLMFAICVCHTSADPVELLPRGWRDVAFARWLHVQSCSMWFMLVVASAACVYETGSLLLFAHVALLLLPLSSFLGVGAPSLSLAGFMSEAVRRGSLSFSLFVVAWRIVCTRRACCLFAHVALLLLPSSLFLGVSAPSLSLGGFRF